jgi:hypothetical protein
MGIRNGDAIQPLGIPEEKIRLVHNGFDTDIFSAKDISKEEVIEKNDHMQKACRKLWN